MKSIPPYVYHVWFKKSKKPTRMVAFDEEHIRDQSNGQLIKKIKKLPEEIEKIKLEPLGPKGCTVNQPADYDKGFKILKAWLDTQDGPPESVRKELRELFIDWQ